LGVIENLTADRSKTDFDSHMGALLELIPVAVYVIDLDYRIQLWNRAAERVYGWSSEEIIGHEPRFIPESQYMKPVAIFGNKLAEVITFMILRPRAFAKAGKTFRSVLQVHD
jgi:PAS domain S-box-containing protein